MRLWLYAPLPLKCGSCGAFCKTNDPMQQLELAGVARKRYRCPSCADEPVDYDQLARGVPSHPREPLSFTRLGDLAPRFDPKLAAANDRE